MNEGLKTLIYVICASLVVVIAYASRPREVDVQEPAFDKPLFAEFKDPRSATRLEIVKVDADLGQLQRFEVARDKKTDRWTIPSHNGYPADAENQMRDVSLMFIDLKPLGLHTTVAEDHPLCGVVDPSQTASGSAKGVGTLVVMEDREGTELAQLIIGKPVKDRENQYFARIPGKDPVYVVQLTPEKLSTQFEDWIEKDLLQLNAWDIEDLELYDYSVIERLEPGTYGITERMQVDLKWQAAKGEWNLEEMLAFTDGRPLPVSLEADEQLNTEKLNELKSALDDLEIVDVHRKPEGMRADLRADKEFVENRDSFRSLVEKGFYPLRTEDGAEIKSANGEIHVGMKDGVKYILRFGDPVKGSGESLNRFLFVMAQFDESKFPMPEPPAGLDAPSTPAAGETQPEPTSSAQPSSAPQGDAPEQPAEEQPADTGTPPGACQEEQPAAEAADETAATEASAAPLSDAGQQADAAAEGGAQQNPTPGSDDAELQRQALEKEYQRQIDERNENIRKGKQRVAELNARFADWYYVISEDIYKKVHLSRADIIKSADGSDSVGVDALRELNQEGLSQ